MKISVVSMGYVGLNLATLLSENNEVIALDIVQDKVDKINKRISPIKDKYIENILKKKTKFNSNNRLEGCFNRSRGS